MALALKVAARMISDGELDKRVAQRYSGWNGEFGQQILKIEFSLATLAAHAQQQQLNPLASQRTPGAAGKPSESLSV